VALPEVFFHSMRRGRRFCVRYSPPAAAVGAVVFIPPLGEEMNKARRMAALASRALADVGWTVLNMDLFGCGDSDGDFAEADWEQWQTDVASAIEWLRDESGCQPMLWGLRAGCLLACDAAHNMNPAPDLLFWQPSISGRQTLQQFLRLRVASQMIGNPSSDRIGTNDLHEQLRRSESVEVAGYTLSPGMALGLEKAQLAPPAAPTHVAWLDIGPAVSADPAPAVRECIGTWKALGHEVERHWVQGPAFWQSQEIAECAELIDATVNAVARARS
jgi:uncharacterized protein